MHPDHDDRARFDQIRSGGRRIHPLTSVARGFLFFAVVIGIATNRLLGEGATARFWAQTGVLMGLLFVIGAVTGYLTWRNTRYELDPDAVRLTTGAFARRDRAIYYRQIQSVDITAPLAARILGLAGLSIDLSGADGSGKLEFLRPATAAALRDELLRRVAQTRGATAAGDGQGQPTGAAASPDSDRLLYKHPPSRIVLAGLISSALPLTLIGTTYAVLDIVLRGEGLRISTVLILIGTLGPLASFIASRWGLTVWTTADGIRVERGLLARSNETVLPGRVQGVVVREPVLWRLAGWRSVHLDVAQGGLIERDPLVTVLAAGSREDMVRILDAVAPEFDQVGGGLRPAPRAARWVRPLAWRHLGWAQYGPLVVARHGWWVRTTQATLHRRVQGITAEQGPLQRRLGLTTLEVSAPMDRNTVRISQVDTAEADRLIAAELAEVYAAKGGSGGRWPGMREPESVLTD